MNDATILVVDDEPQIRRVLRATLSGNGYDVVEAKNGQEAIEVMLEEHPHLILLDVNMPVMNGIEATRLYRFASLGGPHVPIVALTADATAEARARCEEAGMDACVTKPIEPARLLDLIEGLVPRREGTGTARAAAAKVLQHPKLAAGTGVIDRQKLDDLEIIGGKDFVAELVVQFTADSGALVRELAAAVAAGDAEIFRERAHALRSGAANIGARKVFELCLAWRQISTSELAAKGSEHVRKLAEEIDRAAAALADHAAALRADAATEGELARPAGAPGDAAPLSQPA